MKALLYLFASVTIILVSCQSEEVKVLRRIEGTWKIDTLKILRKGFDDSTQVLSNVSISFEPCKRQDNDKGPSYCNAWIKEGSKTYLFNYQVTSGKDFKITPMGPEFEKKGYKRWATWFDGPFEIQILDENKELAAIHRKGCYYPYNPDCPIVVIFSAEFIGD